MSAESSRAAHRTDIQALRTVAVSLVVLYHFWPNAVRGGYVGVDVFFVISGFLITAQLVGVLGRHGGRGLGTFWVRRLRRLLPASLLVLLVSAVAVWWFAPAQDQIVHLRSIIASGLYVSNWQFAADAVDYLGAENVPAVAQHFWSLSVEEQFYLFWPLLLLAAMTLAARRRGRHTVLVTVSVVGVASLVLSLVLTSSDQPYAFFGTPTRIWEFAAGAILALTVPRPAPTRWTRYLAAAGLIALGVSGFVFDDSVAFPGVAAILPVAGAAAVIAAGVDRDWPAMGRIIEFAPVQWIGEHSYGIYLWHWPLIVLAPSVLDRPATLADNLGLLALCLLLAWATKRFVEDPIRFGGWGQARPVLFTASAVLVAMVVVAGTSQLMIESLRDDARERAARSVKLLADPAACVGASLRLDPQCAGRAGVPVDAGQLIPALGGLLEDSGGAYRCYAMDVTKGVSSCTIGSEQPDALRIAVTGDSHAAMLLPALESEADERGWEITALVGRGCVWGSSSSTQDSECLKYSRQLERRLEQGDFDAILVAARNDPDKPDAERAGDATGMARAWDGAISRGVPVIAVLDNPAAAADTTACLAAEESFDEDTCAVPRDEAFPAPDALAAAHELEPRAGLLDFTDAYCAKRCSEVIGGVVVHRDQHHITASFSRSLAPYLADRLAGEMATSRP